MDQVLRFLSDFISDFRTLSGLQGLSLELLGKGTIVVLVVISAMILLLMAILLFRNLVAQSYIIEACIVAQYVQEQESDHAPKAQVNGASLSLWEGIVARIASLRK